jgi:hypothetical protein
MKLNLFLIVGACLSAIAALMHVGCIIYGAPWYRFFGAGEKMARMAEASSFIPTIITSLIVLVLSVWSAYAFSAAGTILPLPFLKPALLMITSIYLLRGFGGLFFVFKPIENSARFWLWSSLICLLFGLTHLIGLWQVWETMP